MPGYGIIIRSQNWKHAYCGEWCNASIQQRIILVWVFVQLMSLGFSGNRVESRAVRTLSSCFLRQKKFPKKTWYRDCRRQVANFTRGSFNPENASTTRSARVKFFSTCIHGWNKFLHPVETFFLLLNTFMSSNLAVKGQLVNDHLSYFEIGANVFNSACYVCKVNLAISGNTVTISMSKQDI